MTHKIGVIGTGVIGRNMIDAMRRHPRFAGPIIWDINPQAAQRVQDEFDDVQIAADVATMLAQPDVEAIYIATPPSTHIAYCRQVLAAGKVIFCEKPLGIDVAESQKLVAEVQAAGVPTAMNFGLATMPEVKKVEQQIRDSELGDLVRLEIRHHFTTWPRGWQQNAAVWLAKRAEGGFLREMFSHFVYVTNRLLGQMELQSGQVIFPKDGETAETQVVAHFRCGDVPVLLMAGVGGAVPDYSEWTLYGTERTVRLDDWRGMQTATATDRFTDVPGDGSDLLLNQLSGLDLMLRGEAHDLPDLAAGLAVQQVVEGLLAL